MRLVLRMLEKLLLSPGFIHCYWSELSLPRWSKLAGGKALGSSSQQEATSSPSSIRATSLYWPDLNWEQLANVVYRPQTQSYKAWSVWCQGTSSNNWMLNLFSIPSKPVIGQVCIFWVFIFLRILSRLLDWGGNGTVLSTRKRVVSGSWEIRFSI
jgi:hypothetical protein